MRKWLRLNLHSPWSCHEVFAGRLALNAVKPNIIRPRALGFGLWPQHQRSCYAASGGELNPKRLTSISQF